MTAQPHVPNTAPKVLAWAEQRVQDPENPKLTPAEARQLSAAGKEIRARYPNVEQRKLAWAAFEMAFRITVFDPQEVVASYGEELRAALDTEKTCRAALHQAALMVVESTAEPIRVEQPQGVRSQAGFAAAARIDRATVNKWMRAVGRTTRRITRRGKRN